MPDSLVTSPGQPNARLLFRSLTTAQKMQCGIVLRRLMNLQNLTYPVMLEIWADAGITGSAHATAVHKGLNPPKWLTLQATCIALDIPAAEVIALSLRKRTTYLDYVRHVRTPFRQAAMLLNGWKQVCIPYLADLRQKRFPPKNMRVIEQRWVAAGLSGRAENGTTLFNPGTLGKWTPDKLHIAIRTLGIQADALSAKLLQMVEHHEKTTPASS